MTPHFWRALGAVRRSQSVMSSVWIGGGGIAVMGGNLLLAGILARQDFGRLILFQSILTVGVGLAPLGLDNLVVRRELPPTGDTQRRVLLAAGAVAAALGVGTAVLYDFPIPIAALLAAGCVVAALARLYAAAERAALRLHRSQLVTQAPSVAYGAGVVLVWLLADRDWRIAAFVMVLGHGVAVVVGAVMYGMPTSAEKPAAVRAPDVWAKAFAFAGMFASVLVLSQMERLVAGRVLSLEDVATFGVVATVAGSPYRLLSDGIGYALMPRLGRASDPEEWARLIQSEVWIALTLGLAGGAVLLVVGGPLVEALYGGKYQAPPALVLAIVLVGMIRLLYSPASAAVSALAQTRELGWFSVSGWITTALAAAVAVGLSRFGLVGVVTGAGVGWAGRLAAAVVLVRPAFRSADPVTPRTTAHASSEDP